MEVKFDGVWGDWYVLNDDGVKYQRRFSTQVEADVFVSGLCQSPQPMPRVTFNGDDDIE